MSLDYAPVPPGCKYFNPRRQRRYNRKTRELHTFTVERRAKAEARAQTLAQVRARVEQERREKNSFKAKVKGFVSRLFGRKTG
jgi:hypothetical protein